MPWGAVMMCSVMRPTVVYSWHAVVKLIIKVCENGHENTLWRTTWVHT